MIKELCDVMEKCYERGWITTRDGNASFRRKDSKFIYITPSGVRKNVLRVEDIVKMTLDNNTLIAPKGGRPSGELDMHYYLQREASSTRSILHVHPTNVVAAMYAGWDLQRISKKFPELYRYTNVAKNVRILPATSKELASETYKALCDCEVDLSVAPTKDNLIYDIVGQDRHGICAVARDPWSAFEHVERLEHVCEIVLKSGMTSQRSQWNT